MSVGNSRSRAHRAPARRTVALDHRTGHRTVALDHRTVALDHRTVALDRRTVALDHRTVALSFRRTVPGMFNVRAAPFRDCAARRRIPASAAAPVRTARSLRAAVPASRAR